MVRRMRRWSAGIRRSAAGLACRRADAPRYGPPIEDAIDSGIAEVQLVRRPREAALRRLQDAFGLPVLTHERDADVPRSRFHRHTHFEAFIRCVHVDFPAGIALCVAREALRRGHPLALAADREALQQRAVQPHVNLVRFAHADQIEVELSLEHDLDRVVAIERELIADRRAAARPEGQTLARPIVLHHRRRDS